MRYIFAILIIWFGIPRLYAQDVSEPEIKTLISKYNEIKGFGAIDFKVTELASETSMMMGAYGGIIVNKQFMLGLGGYGLTTDVGFRTADDRDVDLRGGYGGMMLGFILAPREVVHVSFPVFIGAGSFHMQDERLDFNNFARDVNLESSSFAVVEPGVEIEFNISRLVRLGFGGSYRLIQGSDFREDLSDQDLSGFAGNISVKIGKF